MTTHPLTRSAFLSALIGAGMLATAPAAFAARDSAAESYVQENASQALSTLGNRNITGAERRRLFDQLMLQFSDMDRITLFVVGRYSAQLRADPALRALWVNTFKDYAVAVYEDQSQAYSGSAIRVTGSTERIPGRDIVVNSEITPRGQRALPVQWRLLRSGDAWKVFDVSLIFDGGNQIWLAQAQQLDFLSQLDQTHGDIRALISRVQQTTASLRQHAMASNGR
ncbi:MAG: ABC transporter substrate-binding protein [Proteobacteria bacterium]|nr:ABC transporter substrate-binding protein [Pseudomonadota bacterium]